jgi:hypothetical protein
MESGEIEMNASPIMDLVATIRNSGEITSQEVLALRRAVFGDARVWSHDAEALFDLSQMRLTAAPEWQEFYLEAMTDYLVNQEGPHGYISEQNAQWLIDMIESDANVWTDTELELLVHVLDKAKSSPPQLVKFALEKV